MKSKVLLSFFAMLVVVLVTFSTNVLATKSLVTDLGVDSLKEQALLEIKKEYPDASFSDLTYDEYEELQKQHKYNMKSNESIGTMSSAAPVTDIIISDVLSDNGYDDVWSKSSTDPVKGLTLVRTWVIGYGSTNIWLGSERITFNNPDFYWDITAVDLTGNGIVDAFYHDVIFDSDAKIPSGSSKQFKVQSTSHNMPWNTMVDTLNIVHE